jgi:dipeptidyl aminopeptidase/acylaminoacyl peptidase
MFMRPLRATALAVLILAPAFAFQPFDALRVSPSVVAALQAQAAPAQVPTAADPPRYVLPPQHIVAAFDAEPLPQTLISPNKQVIALLKARSYPTIAELSQPMLRLAGLRVNPKTNGPHRASGLPGTGIYSIALRKIAGGAESNVTLPPQARISHVKFSPDGSRLAFLNTKDDAIELWVADAATGSAKAIASGGDRINATTGDPCDWLKDNVTMVCELVPAGRGPVPVEPTVPAGPTVHENYGKAAPAPTYEDLLKNAHDDALFAHYFTSQLAAINTGSGAKTPIGKPAIFSSVAPAPGGQYVLVTKIKKPFSHTMPMNGFAQDVEIWSRAGEVARKIADQPSREGTTLTGVEPAQLQVARRPAGDDGLGRGAGRRRPPEQGAVPRQSGVARRAVLGPAGRDCQDGMALRRHRVYRQRHRSPQRERSRVAAHTHLAHGAGCCAA